ncbi:PREDICTED: ankyrin repeat-containing protein ITN1-like [Tarenaya hassleriana]|uniref:ankyrin repeat-containing protein ITN1-like n=1 Tax=Tarenaya hassleriana TaxID=28532 RepID=UPI00053C56B1|nr:PREDICTED: ankyrin repeat-containing protein ITN1-like [Tarenaya hassleriana]
MHVHVIATSYQIVSFFIVKFSAKMNTENAVPVKQQNVSAEADQGGKTTDTSRKYLPLSHAISRGDLQGVKDFLDRFPNALTAWIDTVETPLLKACTCGQAEIVKELLRRMTPEQTLNPKKDKESNLAFTPLTIAAVNGNLEIADALLAKNPELAEIADSSGDSIPVITAAIAGHKEMVHFLYQRTPLHVLLASEGSFASNLLMNAVFYGMLDMALQLLEVSPRLAITKHPSLKISAFEVLALKPDLFLSGCDIRSCHRLIYSFIKVEQRTDPTNSISDLCQSLGMKILQCLPNSFGVSRMYELKDIHCKARKFVRLACNETDDTWRETAGTVILLAVRYGNKELLVEMIKSYPDILWCYNVDTGRYLFQMAVEFRKEKIFELIYGLDDRKTILLKLPDKNDNSILHIAGYLSPPEELSRVAGAALKMQRELQWFKEIERIVPDIEKEKRNKEGLTPLQFFEINHEPLRKEAEKWMKGTASACSVVAALIATVTFQAIFTVPGGTKDDSGIPFHLKDAPFMVFVFADILSFFASCTSVLILLGILTDRYAFDDFFVSLPSKMIAGLATLFISVAAMLVAFSTALFTTLNKTPWLVIPVIPLACLPATLFVLMQYPLFKVMISSTYGKGLFNKDTRPWFN